MRSRSLLLGRLLRIGGPNTIVTSSSSSSLWDSGRRNTSPTTATVLHTTPLCSGSIRSHLTTSTGANSYQGDFLRPLAQRPTCPLCPQGSDRRFKTEYELINHLICKHEFTIRDPDLKAKEIFEKHLHSMSRDTAPHSNAAGSGHRASTVNDSAGKQRRELTDQQLQTAPWWCNTCDQGFRIPVALSQHLLQFHNRKLDPVKCPQCRREFSDEFFLEQHVQMQHRNIDVDDLKIAQTFECDFCPRKFVNIADLNEHIELYHPDKAPKVLRASTTENSAVGGGSSSTSQQSQVAEEISMDDISVISADE